MEGCPYGSRDYDRARRAPQPQTTPYFDASHALKFKADEKRYIIHVSLRVITSSKGKALAKLPLAQLAGVTNPPPSHSPLETSPKQLSERDSAVNPPCEEALVSTDP